MRDWAMSNFVSKRVRFSATRASASRAGVR